MLRFLKRIGVISAIALWSGASLAQQNAPTEGELQLLPAQRAPDAAAPITRAPDGVGTGEFIVMLKTSVPQSSIELNSSVGEETRRFRVERMVMDILEVADAPVPDGPERDWVLVGALDGFVYPDDAAALERIAQDERVHVIEEDFFITFDQTTVADDARALSQDGDGLPWGLDRIDQRRAGLNGRFNYAAFDRDLFAYVIDSGTRLSHAEFGGRAGHVKNLVDNNDADCHGHGSHVAGTFGGTVSGVAKTAWIRSYKVFDCDGRTKGTSVAHALNDIFLNGRRPAVVNMSLSADTPPTEATTRMIRRLVNKGIVIVVAAGNDRGEDSCRKWPAGVRAAITVGATNRRDQLASFSNIGRCVDVFAPGVDVVSAGFTSDSSLVSLQGTSMAAPHVAGVALLVLAENPDFTPAEVEQKIIEMSTKDVIPRLPQGTPNRILYYEYPTVPPKVVPIEPDKPVPGARLSVSLADETAVLATLRNIFAPLLNVPLYCAGDPVTLDFEGSQGLSGYAISVEEFDPIQGGVSAPLVEGPQCENCDVPAKVDLSSIMGEQLRHGYVYIVNVEATAPAGAERLGSLETGSPLLFGFCNCDNLRLSAVANFCDEL